MLLVYIHWDLVHQKETMADVPILVKHLVSYFIIEV